MKLPLILILKVIESPQKSKFIPDIEHYDSQEKIKENTQLTIQSTQKDEDLLELERKHTSEIHSDVIRDKFKKFYNSYLVENILNSLKFLLKWQNELNSTIEGGENEESMRKRFWIESSLLKTLQESYQYEKCQGQSNCTQSKIFFLF